MYNKKLIIAHRGFCEKNEKQNTIPSFKKAIQSKADMIEFDVRKTLDNKIIIFHNNKIKGKRDFKINYSDFCKKAKFKVPLLEEALRFLKDKIKINIHLKESGYEEEVIKMALKYFKEKDILISSEFKDSLRKIKENYPKIKTGLVMNFNIKNLIFFPKENAFDFLIPRKQLINPLFIKKAKKLNKQIIPWTINSRFMAKRIMKNKIFAGILTDNLNLFNLTNRK